MKTDILSSIWSSLPNPALIVDEKNLVVNINPMAEAFLNMSEKTIRGTDIENNLFFDFSFSETLTKVRTSNSKVFMSAEKVTLSRYSVFECNLQFSPILDFLNYVFIILDVRDIDNRIGQYSKINETGTSIMGMKEMLSHEIKNPLAGIIGAAQLLSMKLSKRDTELTDLIVEESRRIENLLNNVTKFDCPIVIKKNSENIHDILSRAKILSSYSLASNMTILEVYDPSLPNVWGNFDQLLQVFLNLLKNAAEASVKEFGVIEIRTFFEMGIRVKNSNGENVPVPLTIEVRDDGPGFPSGILSNAFEPFVSGKMNGTGLGLAVVSKIINEHNGWINIESYSGSTVVRVSLPVAKEEIN
jgi:two-component system nitrogen regulation sensor histidine kinase GlnL